MPKHLVFNPKNFRWTFGAAKTPYTPVFLLFIAVLRNRFPKNQQNIDYIDTLQRYKTALEGKKSKMLYQKVPRRWRKFFREFLSQMQFF